MKTLTNSANYGVTLAEASKHIEALEPFHTGTLSGAWEESELLGEKHTLYVVRSYGVKIAVYPDAWGFGGWLEETAYNYSVTTSKHANIVKKAWAL